MKLHRRRIVQKVSAAVWLCGKSSRWTRTSKHAILKNPTELEISRILRSKGMLSMKEDAITKAFKKIIPFEEVNKL